MINNFKLIRPLLNFTDVNDFYFLQILKRRKDNPGMTGDSIVIDNYFIYSYDTFDKIEEKVIKQCIDNNARAYIRLNKRNAKKLATKCLKKVAELIDYEQYRDIKNVYQSVCGEYHSDEDKKWIVDIDDIWRDKKDEIVEIINKIHSQILFPNKPYKIITEIPTKNGYHIITNPFNIELFKKEFREKIGLSKMIVEDKPGHYFQLDIHKDNPTILLNP